MPYTVPTNSPNGVMLGMEACEGRLSFTFLVDFSISLSANIDLTGFFQQGTIKSIQTIYVDNSAGADEVDFIFGQTQQHITVPPGAQGYFPVLQPNSPVFSVSCASANQKLSLQVLNFFVPPALWNELFTITIPALTPLIVNNRLNVRITPQGLVTDTDRSGTITAGGTGQVLMVANANRLQWTLQNPIAATETLQFSKISIAGPWYDLAPGGEAGDDGSTVYQGIIWVIGATTGHAFTADEGA